MWSENIRDENVTFKKFMGSRDGYVYALTSGKGFYVSKYKMSNLALIEKVKVDISKREAEDSFNRVIVINKSGAHVLRREVSAKDKKIRVHHRVISFEGNISDDRVIYSVDTYGAFTNNLHFLDMLTSNDGSKTMISNTSRKNETGTVQELLVFDQDFDLLYKTALSSPFEEDLVFIPTEIKISNTGECYFLGYRKLESKVPDSESYITEKYGLIRFNEEGIDAKFDLSSYKKDFHELSFDINSNNELILLGLFYSDRTKYKSDQAYMKLQHGDMQPTVTSFNSFDKDFLKNFDFDPKTKEKYSFTALVRPRKSILKGFQHFDYKDFIYWPNGEVTAVAERDFGWFHDELMIVQFGAEGEVRWARIIDRFRQESSGFSYYRLHQSSEKLYLIFNDDRRNVERREMNKPPFEFDATGAGGNGKLHTLLAEVDMKGEIEFSEVANYKKRGGLMVASKYLRVSDDVGYFYFAPEYLGGEHILKINFN